MSKKRRKKAQSIEELLVRVDRLLSRGSYEAACRELEQAARIDPRPEITDRLARCRQGADRLRAGDLVRRARKHESRGHLQQALDCLEQARRCGCDEPWAAARIEQLRNQLRGLDAHAAARAAEAAGDFLRATELFGQAIAASGAPAALDRARCLVKAGRDQQAVELYASLESAGGPGPPHDYLDGLALARTGQYHECLRRWEAVRCRDGGFLDQRDRVRRLLADELHHRLVRGDDPGRIFREASFLQQTRTGGGEADAQLEGLVERGRLAWLQQLWAEGQLDLLLDAMRDAPQRDHPALLALEAKACFRLARRSGTHLEELSILWPTVVHAGLRGGTGAGGGSVDAVRERLIELARGLLRQRAEADDPRARRQLVYFGIETELVGALHRLALEQAATAHEHLVCAPRLAERLDRSCEVLALIRDSRELFADEETYLRTGSYYTPVLDSLLLGAAGEHGQAVAQLAHLTGPRDDPFFDHGVKRVRLDYGFDCLQRGNGRPSRYLDAGRDLFDVSAVHEETLIRRALQVENPDELQRYEEALEVVLKQRPSLRLKQTLSLVVSRRAVAANEDERMSIEVLQRSLHRALELDADNAHARSKLDGIQIELELAGLMRAMDRLKLGRASAIARASSSPTVRETFFDMMEELADMLDEATLATETKIVKLTEIQGWCAAVDPLHPLVQELGANLEQIQEGGR